MTLLVRNYFIVLLISYYSRSQELNVTDQITTETSSSIQVVPQQSIENSTVKSSRSEKKLICPGKDDVRRPFFALLCRSTKECLFFGENLLCCENRCLKGVHPPIPEPVHSPILFGLIDRTCPSDPVPEFLEIKKCNTDEDCTPRICCPEKPLMDGFIGFCRTAHPKLDNWSREIKKFIEPFRVIVSYMQCTPPPPPVLDIFPKVCKNGLDCFPNLCCQERGKKYCRPPKRSIFGLLTSATRKIIPSNTLKKFIAKIS